MHLNPYSQKKLAKAFKENSTVIFKYKLMNRDFKIHKIEVN